MAKKKSSAADPDRPQWLDPRVLVGTDHTGVIHRLTIHTTGTMLMERTPYVSTHADGWTQLYEDMTVEASNYYWLIERIEKNPADWPKQSNE